MKQPTFLFAIFLCACSTADKEDPVIMINSDPGCTQIAGEYETLEYRDGSDCGWETDESNYTMRVEQSGCAVTVFLTDGHTATGTVGTGSAVINSTFMEDGGTFTASAQTVSADGEMIQGVVRYAYEADDGMLSCDYEVTVTANKIGGVNNVNSTNNTSLTLEQRVVGAWGTTGECNGSPLQAAIYLCPGGRLRGARTVNNFDFLMCGTWTSTEPDRVTGQERFIAVIDPEDPANDDVVQVEYTYNAMADELVWNGPCAVPLDRAEEGVTEADCESTVCSDGGSGPVECGTDCDCGRCNYCESGTCRYGGEGPFGCYRGCSD